MCNHRAVQSFTLTALLVAAALVGAPAIAMDVDQVIAKHIEAYGGDSAWQQVRTMRSTGTLTAFSMEAPFTEVRKGRHYHLDTAMDGRDVTIGYDGETLWWDNHWRQPGPTAISGIDEQVTRRELDYPTPFFGYAEKGYKLKLIGEAELEGVPAIGVELTRADESVETWYLDPKSYLAVGCESTGSDFGREQPQRTFFDDFRKVGSVTLPFLVEKQWYTRDRVFAFDNIELNVAVEDSLFAFPPPPGMGPLLALAGEWSVKAQNRSSPQGPWQDAEAESKIELLMGRGLLQESTKNSNGDDVLRTWSYDRFKNIYRVTAIDSRRGLMSISEGSFDDDSKLTVSNVETDTPFQTSGLSVYLKMDYYDIADDSFKVDYNVSIDGGENWWVAGKAVYTRAN